MKPASGLALAVGAGLGFLAACFVPPDLGGPYQCDALGQCTLEGFSCVKGLCCKTDGGPPACPVEDAGTDAGDDGGVDGGTDGGADGGDGGTPDAGCVVPADPRCTLFAKKGLCRDGGYACVGDTLTCTQIVNPTTETCDGLDEDCDGVVDNYPCQGGPHDFLTPGADFASGAAYSANDLSIQHPSCLLNDSDPNFPGYLDGGNWRGIGTRKTQFVWFQKDGGGFWDLSAPGESLKITFSGVMRGVTDPATYFAGYAQPIIYLCGPGTPEAYRRYNANGFSVIAKDAGGFFSVNSVLDLSGINSDWAQQQGGGDLSQIDRIEISITPGDPMDGGTVSFDAGITALGFFPL